MLDKDYNIKVGDFGLASMEGGNEDENCSFITNVRGTKPYMPPQMHEKEVSFKGYE